MMTVIVAYAAPDKQLEIPLEVPENCTVALAIERSKIRDAFPEITFPDVIVGINSRKAALDSPLQSGDRVEIYRPLQIDPKEARRLRVERAKK